MDVKGGYKTTEAGLIPDDWILFKQEEIVRYINGRAYKLSEWENYGTPVIRLQNLTGSGETFYYSNLKLPEHQYVNDGDLIFMWSATFGPFIWRGPKAIYHYHIWKIECRPIVEKQFYYHKLVELTESLKKQTNGSTMLHITKGGMEKLVVALPPTKAEQTAIATALSDGDALITSLEKVIAKKRNIKQGAMQELLKPKKGWESKQLSDVSRITRGASPRPIDSPIWFDKNSEVGWVRISDVTKSSKYLKSTTQKLSELGVKHSRYVEKESLIMSICATVGRPIITKLNVCIHDGFVVFQNPCINMEYLYYYLTFIEANWSKHGQTGSQMNLNTSIINLTEIPFPSAEEEQKEIAEILIFMDNEIDLLEGKLEKTLKLKLGMMQSLLTGKIRLV